MEDSKQLVELRRENELFELIPRNLVETMCDKLPIKDQFQFARVCKLAHSLIFERSNPLAKDTPWLISIDDNSSSLCKTIYDNQVTCYSIATRPFKYSKPNILGYSKGWLYVYYSSNDIIQLVNYIFVNVHIDLPSLSTMVIPEFKSRYLYAQAFALSLCKSMRPVMVAIVDQNGDLALCKTNGGNTWKAHQHHRPYEGYYVNVAFNHEKLCAMRKKKFHTVDIFKVGYDDLRLFPMRNIEYKNVINISFFNLGQQAYLVGDFKGGNMFIVMEYQHMFGKAFEFEVFKVENDGDELVRVNNLGNQIILLDDSYSEIIDAKDCSNSDIFKGNQICFKGSFYQNVGIHSLKDGTTIWEYPKRGVRWQQWIFPKFITAAECNCESHR